MCARADLCHSHMDASMRICDVAWLFCVNVSILVQASTRTPLHNRFPVYNEIMAINTWINLIKSVGKGLGNSKKGGGAGSTHWRSYNQLISHWESCFCNRQNRLDQFSSDEPGSYQLVVYWWCWTMQITYDVHHKASITSLNRSIFRSSPIGFVVNDGEKRYSIQSFFAHTKWY